MIMPGRSYTNGNQYRYGFNGKEQDKEVVQYDYGFRIYDPRLVRFKSIDPLQKKFPYFTPYQFAGNTPIQAVDLDGREPTRPKALTSNLGLFKPELKTWTYMALLPSERAAGGYELITMGSSKGVVWGYEYFLWTGTATYAHTQEITWVMFNGALYNANGLNNVSPKDLAGKETWEQYWEKQTTLQDNLQSVSDKAGLVVAGVQLADGFKNLHKAYKSIAAQRVRNSLIKELAENGIKHNADDIVDIAKSQSGKTVFLETGNSKAGLTHILQEHGSDFVKAGIKQDDIAKVVMDAATNGKQVGMQGTRPVYEVMYNGAKQNIAVTVGNNGFIVGANPSSNFTPIK